MKCTCDTHKTCQIHNPLTDNMNTHTAYTGKRDPINCPANQPKPTTHIKDCHLGNNWEDCPACVENHQEMSDQSKILRGARKGEGGRISIQPKPTSGQRLAVASEWTAEYGDDLAMIKFPDGGEVAIHGMTAREAASSLLHTHNAALAAERERFNTLQRQAEELHGRAQRAEQQLAAAQAAIVKKNAYLKTAMEGATNDKLRNSSREGLAIPSDTAALDAAIAAARQPLMELISQIPDECRFGGAGEAYGILTNLVSEKRKLAKVGKGK